MEFSERTIKVIIDDKKCVGCKTHACAAACKLYSRGILIIKDGKPVLGGDAAYAERVGTECLACEYECWFRGTRRLRSRRRFRDWMNIEKNTESSDFGF